MLSKKVNHKRLKPKAKKLPKYLEWLHNQNDIVCFSCGKQNGLEVHHVKETSTDERDDSKVLMLCGEECHRNGMKLSPHSTPVAWRRVYPIQMQLDYASDLFRRYKQD